MKFQISNFKFQILFSILVVAGLVLLASPTFASAPTTSDDLVGTLRPEINKLNKLGQGTSVQTLIGRGLSIILQVSGSIAVIVFVAGGILWMTARGNSEKMVMATKTLVWGALGVVVILTSYIIVQFVFQAIG